jgi:hypothetical protein
MMNAGHADQYNDGQTPDKRHKCGKFSSQFVPMFDGRSVRCLFVVSWSSCPAGGQVSSTLLMMMQAAHMRHGVNFSVRLCCVSSVI